MMKRKPGHCSDRWRCISGKPPRRQLPRGPTSESCRVTRPSGLRRAIWVRWAAPPGRQVGWVVGLAGRPSLHPDRPRAASCRARLRHLRTTRRSGGDRYERHCHHAPDLLHEFHEAGPAQECEGHDGHREDGHCSVRNILDGKRDAGGPNGRHPPATRGAAAGAGADTRADARLPPPAPARPRCVVERRRLFTVSAAAHGC